jgi:hypothetical protein
MSEKPDDVDLFLARWKDRLALAVSDDEAAARFARFMAKIAPQIEVIPRPPFGQLCSGPRWNR